MTRTTLFTGIGSGIGGIGGYLLAVALPPLVGCLIGVFAVGGDVLLGHTIFHYAGVIVVYDITLGEKLDKNIVHNGKMFKKIAGNASEIITSNTTVIGSHMTPNTQLLVLVHAY